MSYRMSQNFNVYSYMTLGVFIKRLRSNIVALKIEVIKRQFSSRSTRDMRYRSVIPPFLAIKYNKGNVYRSTFKKQEIH